MLGEVLQRCGTGNAGFHSPIWFIVRTSLSLQATMHVVAEVLFVTEVP